MTTTDTAQASSPLDTNNGPETMAPAGGAPTSVWLATLPALPPLSGSESTAERLLLLVHYGVDWTSWVGKHRHTYWSDLLPHRVQQVAYRSSTLSKWWSRLTAAVESAPRTAAERAEAAQLLRTDSGPVLELFRDETEALLLRTRLVADAVRSTRQEAR